MTANEQIDAYLATLPEWQRSMAVRLRAIIHEAVPDNVFNGASVADPDGLFNSGFEAKSSRTIDLREGEPLDDDALVRLIRRAAGG